MAGPGGGLLSRRSYCSLRIRGGMDVFVPPACSQGASMKMRFIIVVIAIAAMPLSAQAQKTGAAKVTKADA